MDIQNSTNYDYRANTTTPAPVSAESKASQTKSDYSVHGAKPATSPAESVTLPEGVSKAAPSSADQMILKALTASGLPASERNRTLVMELLQHKLPIDKQTLQMFAKLAATNRNASSMTLILLYKNQIPITPANIRQFDAYQNGTHQLLKDIQSLSKSILELMKALSKVQEPGASSEAAVPNSTAPFHEASGSVNQATGQINPNISTTASPPGPDGTCSTYGPTDSASPTLSASQGG